MVDQVQDTKAVEERLQEAWTEVAELQDEVRTKDLEVFEQQQVKEDLYKDVAQLAQQLQVCKLLMS